MANSWQQTFDELGLDQELLEQVVTRGPLAGKFLKHLQTDELKDLSKSKKGKEPQKSILIKAATMIVARFDCFEDRRGFWPGIQASSRADQDF